MSEGGNPISPGDPIILKVFEDDTEEMKNLKENYNLRLKAAKRHNHLVKISRCNTLIGRHGVKVFCECGKKIIYPIYQIDETERGLKNFVNRYTLEQIEEMILRLKKCPDCLGKDKIDYWMSGGLNFEEEFEKSVKKAHDEKHPSAKAKYCCQCGDELPGGYGYPIRMGVVCEYHFKKYIGEIS
jgi:hypothetical protein